MGRSKQTQERIDRLLRELVDQQCSRVRFAIDNYLEYLVKYERHDVRMLVLIRQGWDAAKATPTVKLLCTIADENPDDVYVISKTEINSALYSLAAEETRLSLLENSHVDRLARDDGFCAKSRLM
jgi:hypothetical protein